MGRDSFLSKVGLTLGCLVAVVLIFVAAQVWFQRDKSVTGPVSSSSATRSPAGWEVRYNATLGLARRGSALVKNRLDVLAEMLDEQQQRQNFRGTGKNGTDVPNETEVFQTLSSTLKAVAELHRRQPDLDLSELYPAVRKLTEAGNPVLRGEALRTKEALNIP
jgi:hypothetical protein